MDIHEVLEDAQNGGAAFRYLAAQGLEFTEENYRHRRCMKKVSVILSVLFASTLLLAAGQARVNFVNHTSMTLRFSIDGNPACAGDIIPNGTCTEYTRVGARRLGAVDVSDSRNVISQTRDLDDDEPYTWVVSEN